MHQVTYTQHTHPVHCIESIQSVVHNTQNGAFIYEIPFNKIPRQSDGIILFFSLDNGEDLSGERISYCCWQAARCSRGLFCP